MSIADNCLRTIKQLRNTGSRIEKEELLGAALSSPTFRRIVIATYNPFMKYHIRRLRPHLKGRGNKDLTSTSWDLLNQLVVRSLTGTAARESLFEHIESLNPAAAEVFILVVKKDLRCGVAVKTINRVMPGLIPEHGIQLAKQWDSGRIRLPSLVSAKIDGVRAVYRSGSFYTRNGYTLGGLDHIANYINRIGTHLILDGELSIKDMEFNRASGIIRSNKPQKLNVIFTVFDIPSLDQMPLDQRYKYITTILHPMGTEPPPVVTYVPHLMMETMDEVDKYYDYCRARKLEGIMVKYPNSFYQTKRSYEWMKKKPCISLEFEVLDTYEGEGKYEGMLGGVVIEGGIGVGSGFSDDERVKYWDDKSLIQGQSITVEAMERTPSGSLRHPVFKGIRWDI